MIICIVLEVMLLVCVQGMFIVDVVYYIQVKLLYDI